jgi:flagellar hook-length control protein FliK
VTPAGPGTDKDKPAATEAPWPPLGLAGLVLAMPTPADPAAALPTAAPCWPATAALPAAPCREPGTACNRSSSGHRSGGRTANRRRPARTMPALPLPEMILPGKRSERGEGSDVAAVGDRASAPPLHAPAAAAVQDLEAALATGNAIFNGEPTPKPVLGDDGFDQAIGARLGWLADQKIGHAHIRLSPDDMGPVDVRLQLNGDKVHASFSSPRGRAAGAGKQPAAPARAAGRTGLPAGPRRCRPPGPGGDGNASGALATVGPPATENRRRARPACRPRS